VLCWTLYLPETPIEPIILPFHYERNVGYKELKVVFRPQQSGTYYVFTGLWALNQDTWAQVDEFRVTGGACADT